MDTIPDADTLKEIPRQYQLELYEKAKSSNVIAVLDTGSGKTLIALLILKHMAAISTKISLFLVPTVPLVSQQANYISTNSSLKVFHVWGGMIDTSWTDYKQDHDVFVMTPSMLQRALDEGTIRMNEIHLIVFDECHHCRANHPYNLIMSQHYDVCDPASRPKIFGMTASPYGSNEQTLEAIEHLERNLDAVCVSSSSMLSLKQYVSRPTERIVYYEDGDFFDPPSLFLKMMQVCPLISTVIEKEVADCMVLSDILGPWAASRALELAIEELGVVIKRRIRAVELELAKEQFEIAQKEQKKPADQMADLNKSLEDLSVAEKVLEYSELVQSNGDIVNQDAFIVEDDEMEGDEFFDTEQVWKDEGMGVEPIPEVDVEESGQIIENDDDFYMKRKGSDLLADGLFLKAQKFDHDPLEKFTKEELEGLLRGCDELMHEPYWGIRAPPPKEHEIGAKVKCLVKILLEFEAEKEFFCGIVFCQQRIMAHVLKMLLGSIRDLDFIRCEYLLGHGAKSTWLYRKSCLTAVAQQSIVNRFRAGEVNLLIATSVAEEGLDIKPCNCVIRFDMLDSSLTSYIQSRGRARHRTSQFIIIAQSGDNTPQHLLQCILF